MNPVNNTLHPDFSFRLSMSRIQFISTHSIEIAKEQGANKLLTNCPPCILFLEQGLELVRELGEPMECGIFDFYKVFSRAFGEEEDGVGGVRVGSEGCCQEPGRRYALSGASQGCMRLPVKKDTHYEDICSVFSLYLWQHCH